MKHAILTIAFVIAVFLALPAHADEKFLACRDTEELTPLLFFDADTAKFAAIYAFFENSTTSLYVQQYNATWFPETLFDFSPTLRKQLTFSDSYFPSLAKINATFYLAYSGSDNKIYLNAYDNASWNMQSSVLLTQNNTPESEPSLIFYNSSFYISYQSFETGKWHIFVRKLNTTLDVVDKKQLTFSVDGELSPSLVAVNGSFYLAYASYVNKSNGIIFVDRYDTNLNVTGHFVVSDMQSHALFPSMLYDNGRFFVAYMRMNTDATPQNWDIVLDEFDINFTKIGSRQFTNDLADQAHPSLAFAGGAAYIAYATQEKGMTDIKVKWCEGSCIKPDISVASVIFDKELEPGQNGTVFATISNAGNIDAENFTVAFSVDGIVQENMTVSLQGNAFESVNFSWTAQLGLHDLRIIADANNIINESDESNNNASSSYGALALFLAKGMNLISSPFSPQNSSVARLAEKLGNFSIIWSYNSSDFSDPWKSYDKSAPDFANDLLAFSEQLGYWVNMTVNKTIYLTGSESPFAYMLHAGWNLVGYPSMNAMSPQDFQSNIMEPHGNFSSIWTYNASDADPLKQYNPFNASQQELLSMAPGFGYWIYLPDSDNDSISDGQEIYDFFREERVESEDYITSTMNPNTAAPNVDLFQFGIVLKATSGIPFAHGFSQINLTLPVQKSGLYRITTEGTGKVEFREFLLKELCDFDATAFSGEIILNAPLMNLSRQGIYVNAFNESRNWTQRQAGLGFIEYYRTVAHESSWRLSQEYLLTQGNYTLSLAIQLPPKNVSPQFQPYVDTGAVIELDIRNSAFILERLGLNSTNNDTDADGLSDGSEFFAAMYPLNADADEDGLSDAKEFILNTNAEFRDSDFDGVLDSVELGLNGSDSDALTPWDTNMPNHGFYNSRQNIDGDAGDTTTDPLDRDSDNDGLPDGWVDGWTFIGSQYDTPPDEWGELFTANNLLNIPMTLLSHERWEGEDFDADGIVDAGPWNGTSFFAGRTDPNNNDTDGDLLPDAWEAYYRINPLLGVGPDGADGDADVLAFEINETPLPDGLSNLNEFIARTNPRDFDTDDDALFDGPEAGTVIFRTNVPDGAREFTYYSYLNTSGQQEWLWFNGSTYAFESTMYGAPPFFSVDIFLEKKFIFSPSLENLIFIASLDDYAYIFLNRTQQKIFVCSGLVPVCHIYASPQPVQINATPSLAFKNSELYVADPLSNHTDGDMISDSEEPSWDEDTDADGVANARDLDADGDSIPDWYENTIYSGGERFFVAVDTDSDGLLDMIDMDTDSDGLTDFEERPFIDLFTPVFGTSYTDPDSDGDGLLDGSSINVTNTSALYAFFISRNIYFTESNATFIFIGEAGQGTSPLEPDTDNDRLVDGANRQMNVQLFQGVSFGEISAATNATNPDTDGDGVPDGAEVWGWPVYVIDIDGNTKIITGTSDPLNGNDTDSDGLADGKEAFVYNGNNSDTDGDCLADGVEDSNGNMHLDANETSPLLIDSDKDFLPDGRFDLNGNNIIEPFEKEDANCNGFESGETNPKSSDTDNDGLPDGLEIKIVIFRTNVLGGNYSKPDAWLAVDIGEEKFVMFRSTTLNLTPYLPGRKLNFTTPEGFGIYYNWTYFGGVLFIKNASLIYNFTWDTDLEPEKAFPTGQFASGEVFVSLGNALVNDTDADALADGDEFYNLSRFSERYLQLFDADNDSLTTMNDNDSDNDFIIDSNDLWHTTNQTAAPYYNGSTQQYWEQFYYNDFDGDLLPNGLDVDSDNDIIFNASWTDGGEDTNHDGRRQFGELNPLGDDADEDGIKDAVEQSYGLNILNADTDHDGVADGAEAQWSETIDEDAFINALDPDADGDGLLDGESQIINAVNSTYDPFLNKTLYAFFVQHGISSVNITNDTFEFIGESSLGTNPWNADTDADGLWDGFNPTTSRFYEGDITIGSIKLNTKSSFFSDYYYNVISRLPLKIYGELSLGADPLNPDTDNDMISDGDEANGYFKHDRLMNCEDFSLASYQPLTLTMSIIEPGDYMLSLRTRPVYENIGYAGPLEISVFNVSGDLRANFYETYDAHIARIDTQYYPYQPGYTSAYGIISYYTHNFNLPNLSAGTYDVVVRGTDLIVLDNDFLILKRGGLDTNNPDTDNDTLADGFEVYNLSTGKYETFSRLADSDSDSLPDSNDTLPGVIPAEAYYFRHIDFDGDNVWDGIDFNPNATVAINWTNIYPPGAIEFNSTYRIWGFKGAGCQDKLIGQQLFSNCKRNAGQPHDYGGKWIDAAGLALSTLTENNVKKEINEKSLKGLSYKSQSVRKITNGTKVFHSDVYPYSLYHPHGYYPSYKIFYEPTYELYDTNVENYNNSVVSLNGRDFYYAISSAELVPEKRQEFVIQFSVLGEGFMEDENNYRLPFFMYALYNSTFDEDALIYKNLARSTILDAVTCSRRPYEAHLLIPQDIAKNFTQVLLYISPFWIENKEGDITRIPIQPYEISFASLGHTYTKYAYTIVTNLTENLTIVANATPENIQDYAQGIYNFQGLTYYVLKDDGDDDVESNQLVLLNNTFLNYTNMTGVVIVSDNKYAVEVFLNNIPWPANWTGNAWLDNLTIGGKSFNRLTKVKDITFSFVRYDQILNLPDILSDSEGEDDDDEGNVKFTLMRIGIETEANKYEASVDIKRNKKLEINAPGYNAYKTIKKAAQKIHGEYEKAIDQALQAGMLKDDAYDTALATHNRKFRAHAAEASRLGKLKKVGEVLFASEDLSKAVVAFKNGDRLEASYYTLRTGLDVAEAVFDSSYFAKSIGGVKVYPPRLGLKIATSFEVAKGAAELGYQLIKAGETKEPIARYMLYEDAAATGTGMALAIASYFYPPLMVIDPAYAATAAAISAIAPCDKAQIGCKMSQRVGSFEGAVVFLGEVLSGNIPATIVEDAFNYAKVTLLGGKYNNVIGTGWINVYNSPSSLAVLNEPFYPQVLIKPEVD